MFLILERISLNDLLIKCLLTSSLLVLSAPSLVASSVDICFASEELMSAQSEVGDPLIMMALLKSLLVSAFKTCNPTDALPALNE